jgi:hypothetical protein
MSTRIRTTPRHGAAALLAALAGPALAQTAPSPAGDGGMGTADNPAATLKKFTLDDGSASAGLPPGWHFTKGGQTVIMAAGPRGEKVFLGNTAIAHDGDAGTPPPKLPGVDLSLPYNLPITDKFLQVVQHANPKLQVSIIKSMDLQVPPALGHCARIVGDMGASGENGPSKFETVFCSLPRDAGGFFKNIIRMATVPVEIAAQERPLLEAVIMSYQIPPEMLKRKLGPYMAPPQGVARQGPGGGAGGGPGAGGPGGGSPGGGGSTADINAQAIAQIQAQTRQQQADSIRNAESFDSLLRQ